MTMMDDPAAFHAEGEIPAEQRRDERDRLLLAATLQLADGTERFAIRVRNLSASGLMAEGPFRILVGTQVVVEVRNVGWIPGTVAWAVENRFGIAFAEQIDPKAARQAPPAPPPVERVDMVVRLPLVAGKPRLAEPVQRPTRFL